MFVIVLGFFAPNAFGKAAAYVLPDTKGIGNHSIKVLIQDIPADHVGDKCEVRISDIQAQEEFSTIFEKEVEEDHAVGEVGNEVAPLQVVRWCDF